MLIQHKIIEKEDRTILKVVFRKYYSGGRIEIFNDGELHVCRTSDPAECNVFLTKHGSYKLYKILHKIFKDKK